MRPLILFLSLLLCCCEAQDDAGGALDDARRLAEQGDYEGALAKHVWFHDHALKVDPSYYGVRLSFALGEWMELGTKFPKALVTLEGIRDTKTAKLVAGELSRELFHDVTAINRHLGESAATVALFKRLEATNPAFAGTLYDVAEEALLEAREYALAKKYLGDPEERLTRARRGLEQGMQFARARKEEGGVRQAFESIFVGEIIRLITVLKETGDEAAAKAIQAEARKTLDHDAIRTAFEP